MDGESGATFWFFKSLDNNMIYSLGIGLYICQGIVAEQKSYEFKNLVKLETVPMKIKSLDKNLVYLLRIEVYVNKRNLCRTKVLWV